MNRHILHEGDSAYIELSSLGVRCPRCGALLSRDGAKYLRLDGLQVIQRPRPGEKRLCDFGLAREHDAQDCQAQQAHRGAVAGLQAPPSTEAR